MVNLPILVLTAMSAGVIWFLVMMLIASISRILFSRGIKGIINVLAESAVACEETMHKKVTGEEFDEKTYVSRFMDYIIELSDYIYDEAEPYTECDLGFIVLYIYNNPYKWFSASSEILDIVNDKLEGAYNEIRDSHPDIIKDLLPPRVSILGGIR